MIAKHTSADAVFDIIIQRILNRPLMVLLSKLMVITFNEPIKVSKKMYHSFEAHNFWITRHKVCPYCLLGSKPVPKAMIIDNLERR